jgi:UDP-glucose:(heptosyl)LPS alpha-1,3-glucosyltransferase
MKLALVCRPFTFHGGVETATAGLVGELARRGHSVTLLTTRAQRPVEGVRVRRLPVLSQPSLLRLISFGMAARATARAGGYDIVQTHERMTGADVYRAGEGTHRGYLQAMGRPLQGSRTIDTLSDWKHGSFASIVSARSSRSPPGARRRSSDSTGHRRTA